VLDLAVDLTTALGAALAPPLPQSTTRTLKAAAPVTPPVFQMAALPSIVDPATYANAFGNTNPNGSFLALRALRDLVDPVPLFSRTYQPSPESTEKLWGLVLSGAESANGFAAAALSGARTSYATSALPSTDGTTTQWRPVYATPATWMDLGNDAAFRKVTVDLSGTATGATATRLSTIGGGQAVMRWTVVDANGDTTTAPIASGTTLDAIVLDVRQVTLQRPWLDMSVLTSSGIAVPGQDAGFLSSGDVDDNDGSLPLLPTAFWLARSATLRGTIAPSDAKVLGQADDDTHVTLGGIAVAGPAAEGAPTTGQVVAWTSTLLPYWPKS